MLQGRSRSQSPPPPPRHPPPVRNGDDRGLPPRYASASTIFSTVSLSGIPAAVAAQRLVLTTAHNSPQSPLDGHNPGNNLHVSNLSLRTRSQDLEKLFGEYGKISKAEIVFDPHTQESRGFGFVTFQKAEHAEEARVGIDGRVELDSKVLRVQMAKRSRARDPTPGRYCGAPRPIDRERDDERRYGRDRYDPYDRYDRYDPRERRRSSDRYESRHTSHNRDRYDDRYGREYQRYDDDRDRRRY